MADPILGYNLEQQGVNLTKRDAPIFNYRYPLSKLTDSDDYLKISVLEYIPPGFIPEQNTFALPSSDTVGYDKVVPKGTIILPIPDEVQDTNSANWGSSSYDPVQGALAAGVQGLYESGSVEDATSKFNTALGKISNASKTGTIQKYFQALGIGLASNVLLGQQNFGNTLSRFSGKIVNSNVELIFSSVNIREPFNFAFDIVPRSEKEAKEIKNIIKTLKKFSSAKKSIGAATGLFLKAPDVFKLEYMNGGQPHPFLNRFKICALQGMSVNYNPGGTYATYSDATPVNMTLSLTFQELTPIYAEDYDSAGGTGY